MRLFAFIRSQLSTVVALTIVTAAVTGHRPAASAPPGPDCASMPAGVVSCWSAEGNAQDTMGINPGTVQGGVTFAPGVVGQAFSFDGTGSVVVPDSSSLDLASGYTLSAWIKPTAKNQDPAHGGIISKVGGPGGNNGYQFLLTGDNSAIVSLFNAPGESWGTNVVPVWLGQPISTDAWTHVATTFDGEMLAVYVNGVQVGMTVDAPKTVVNSTSSFRISGDDNNNVKFVGLIDEVAVFNRALSANELATMALAPVRISAPLMLDQAVVGHSYAQTITASDGAPPYAFSIAAGTLPAGLSLSNDGTISGTPSAAGAWTFTVEVADAGGQSATKTYLIAVHAIATDAAPALDIESDGRLGAGSQYFPYDWLYYYMHTDSGKMYRQYSNYPWEEIPAPDTRLVLQEDGPAVRVFDFTSFTLPPKTYLTIVGSHPAVIAATDDITINGILRVIANGGSGGFSPEGAVGGTGVSGWSPPGSIIPNGGRGGEGPGGWRCSYLAPDATQNVDSGGGGGGGGSASVGGSGAAGKLAEICDNYHVVSGYMQRSGGAGGYPTRSDVLQGGGGGGQGGYAHFFGQWFGGRGGNGGGALMFASRGNILLTGTLTADGESGGYYDGYGGGGGGGGGGYLLFKAGGTWTNHGIVSAAGGPGSRHTAYGHGGGGAGGRVSVQTPTAVNHGRISISSGGGPAASGGQFTIGDAAFSGSGTISGMRAAATATGSNVNVSALGATLSFAAVTSSGDTSVVPTDSSVAGAVPPGYTLIGTGYDITTTAVFEGSIDVCLTAPPMDQASFARLRVLHGENGALVDRTILSPDAPAPVFAQRRICARVSSLSPFVLALTSAAPPPAPTHFWRADYTMEWVTTPVSGDQILDGSYPFRYTWRFGMLNDPMAPLDTPILAVTTGLSGLTPQQPPNVALTQDPGSFVWSGPQLAPQGQAGSAFFTALVSQIPVPGTYPLGFDAMRSLSGGIVPAGTTQSRTFTLTLVPRDPALTLMGASVNFDLFPGPGARPVVASDVLCTSDEGRVEPFASGLGYSFHIGTAISQDPLPPGTSYMMRCTLTVTNTTANPAVFTPNASVSGARTAPSVRTDGTSTGFTTDPSLDPWDPLGQVQYTVGAGESLAALLDKRFSRFVTLEGANRIIDNVAPVTTATTFPTEPNGNDGWFRTPTVAVTLSATDAGGVRDITYSMAGAQIGGPGTAPGSVLNLNVGGAGTTTITFSATDFAGNVEAAKSIAIKRDSIAPASNFSLTPGPIDGWNRGAVSVTLSATDTVSGVREICGSLSGATIQPQTCIAGDGVSFTVDAAGATDVSFYAVDVAGNAGAPRNFVLRIDNSAPSTTASLAPPNPLGWYTANVPVTLNATDAVSALPFSGIRLMHYTINGIAQPPVAGLSASFMVTAEGTNEVHYWSEDRAGNVEAAKVLRIDIDKTIPAVTVASAFTTSEGTPLVIPFTASDAGGGSVMLHCGVTSGTGAAAYANGACTYTAGDGPAAGVVTIAASDGHGNTGYATTTVSVVNVAPAIVNVSGPTAPLRVGTPAIVSAAFADPGVLDAHTCTFAWSDGTVTTSDAVANACSSSHTYAAAGVYSVNVTVTDDDGGASTAAFNYVVVYSPDAGSVTGGGTIAPASGRANFGFNAKYQNDQPVGQTQFQFQGGKLNFHSTAYDWLVVADGFAVYEGKGTINRTGSYVFRVVVTDARVTGAASDTFRIQIWDADGAVVYDAEPGGDAFALPALALSGGNIAIHR